MVMVEVYYIFWKYHSICGYDSIDKRVVEAYLFYNPMLTLGLEGL